MQKQCETGIDIVNNGEMSKFFYATYIKERLNGFEGDSIAREIGDTQDFPEYTARINSESRAMRRTPACNGPIAHQGRDDLEADLANLAAATADDLGRTVETADGIFHLPRLQNSPSRLKPFYADSAKCSLRTIGAGDEWLRPACSNFARFSPPSPRTAVVRNQARSRREARLKCPRPPNSSRL